MPTIRLATASPAARATTAKTLADLALLARRAAAPPNPADILLLPEAYLGGYPRGSTFGCAIGDRTAAGRDEYLAYFKNAVDLGDVVGDAGGGGGDAWVRRELGGGGGRGLGQRDGGEESEARGDGTREQLEEIARTTGVFLVVGLVEKAGGSLYCSVVYVCPAKGMIGKRRKVMPTGSERLVWAQGSPSTLRAVSTTIRGTRVNLAAAICWENYMPLVRQSLYAQNVNLYLAPTADTRDTWLGLMRTVAIEGRCFVVSSNMAVRSASGNDDDDDDNLGVDEAPREFIRRPSPFGDGHEIIVSEPVESTEPEADTGTEAQGGWVSRGGSCIVSPFGDVLAGPQWEDSEGILFVDVDFEDCIRGRLDLDAAGSYSRNDSFKFSVEGLDLEPLPY